MLTAFHLTERQTFCRHRGVPVDGADGEGPGPGDGGHHRAGRAGEVLGNPGPGPHEAVLRITAGGHHRARLRRWRTGRSDRPMGAR